MASSTPSHADPPAADEGPVAPTELRPAPARQSEEFRLLAEHSTDVITRHTPSGRIIYVSPAVRTLLGYEPEVLVGRHVGEMAHPDDGDTFARAIRMVAQGAGLMTIAYRIRHRHDRYVWFESTIRAVRDPDTGEAVEIHASSRDVSARKAAEANLARETNRLATLARLDLLGGESIYDTLTRICEAATELLPASKGASVLLWDGATETFSTSASTLGDPHGPSTAARARRRGGASRRIIDTQAPFVVPDLDDSPLPPNKMTRDEGIRAFAGVPILAEGEALGVLYALDAEPRRYLGTDVAFLETLAKRAASAIVHARLLEELRKARRQAEALNAVGRQLIGARSLDDMLHSVAAGAADATDADWSLVMTIDLAAEVVNKFIMRGPGDPVPPDEFDDYMSGLTGWAIRQNELAFSPKGVPDMRESEAARRKREERGVGSVIVAPLVFEGRPVGTLTVMRRHERPDYTEEDLQLVESMAAQATVAIEHARLNEATRVALDEVQTLFELARALSMTRSVDDLLQKIVDTVAAKLPADRVTLFGIDLDEKRILHAHRGGRGADRVYLEVGMDELLQGLTGWALRYGRPAVSPRGAVDERESEKVRQRRVETGAGSIVVVPLRHRGETLGTMTAINGVDDRDFDDGDVALLQAMASQAAVALTDALLLEEVQRLAVTDALTGIYNRGHLFEVGTREFNSAFRYQRPLAVIMFDVDRFKEVNDEWGHAIGDEVLCEVVNRCQTILREVDVFGRYGGEEFAILLPETGIENARAVADRLRVAVEHKPVATTGGRVPVTISVGLASIEQGIETLPDLLDRADAELMAAKRAGRNTVRG